jgi:hypothetical protein
VWLAGLVKLDGFQGRASLALNGSRLDVRALRVVAGPFEILGELTKKGDAVDGIALISADPFAVGVEVVRGNTELKIYGATDWYRQSMSARSARGM